MRTPFIMEMCNVKSIFVAYNSAIQLLLKSELGSSEGKQGNVPFIYFTDDVILKASETFRDFGDFFFQTLHHALEK